MLQILTIVTLLITTVTGPFVSAPPFANDFEVDPRTQEDIRVVTN